MVTVAVGQGQSGVRMVADVELDVVQPVVTSIGVVKQAPLGAVKRTTTLDDGKYNPVRVMSSRPATLPEVGLTAWTSRLPKLNDMGEAGDWKTPPLNEWEMAAGPGSHGHEGVRIVAEESMVAFQPTDTTTGVTKHGPLGAVKRIWT